MSLALLEMLRNPEAEGTQSCVWEAVRKVAQLVIEKELKEAIGAGWYERTGTRTNHRNGPTEKDWDTTVRTLTLDVPKLRKGSFFPALLERRRRVDKALANVVVEAYIQGVSTRKPVPSAVPGPLPEEPPRPWSCPDFVD